MRLRLPAVVTISLILTAGCSAAAVQPTLTLPQAEQRLEEHAQKVISLLPTERSAVLRGRDSLGCDDPSDGGPPGRVSAGLSYQVEDLESTDYSRYFDTVLSWWQANGYRILTDDRPQRMYIWTEHSEDAFRIAIRANDVGGFYINGSSPCVWPDGTPGPE